MISLFGDSEPGGKRDVLEGRLIWLALEALRLGTSVILDFGFWARNERSALRWLAASAGASCQVVYLPVDRPPSVPGLRTARRTRTRRSPSARRKRTPDVPSSRPRIPPN